MGDILASASALVLRERIAARKQGITRVSGAGRPWRWHLAKKPRMPSRLGSSSQNLWPRCKRLRAIAVADAYRGKIKSGVPVLTWNGTPWTFTANLIRRDWLRDVLGFLARKEVPLSRRAARLLSEHPR